MKKRICKLCKRTWGVSTKAENKKHYICPQCAERQKKTMGKG